MTTTNALTFLLRDVELKKPGDVHIMPIDKSKAELMDFGKVLEHLGNGVASEKSEMPKDFNQTNLSETSGTEETFDNKSEYGRKISEKIKTKQPQETKEEIPAELAEEFGEGVVSLVCAMLDVTLPELETKMQELGMESVADLLEPSKLANLFVNMSDDVSIADVLVSEEFQMLKNQIGDLVAEFSTEFGFTEAEVKSFFETVQMLEIAPQEQEQVSKEVVLKADAKNEVSAETVNNRENEADPETVVVKENNEKSVQQQMSANADANENGEDENPNTEKEFKVEYKANDRMEVVRDDISGQTTRQTNVITTTEGTVVQESVKVVDLQNLVSEVTEYVRLTTGNELSKIEMQINPANLGKMIVEVSSSNGEVTTKIIAQTEAGKEAIESNINQMRSNLEQQGVKVAAIEVTVESHAFEQNLQEQSNNEQEQLMRQQQEENRKHQMNLNLNEMTLDDLSGLMSEEEMLTVRMMRENGNKIDLTV